VTARPPHLRPESRRCWTDSGAHLYLKQTDGTWVCHVCGDPRETAGDPPKKEQAMTRHAKETTWPEVTRDLPLRTSPPRTPALPARHRLRTLPLPQMAAALVAKMSGRDTR
jgi:hypothetical protein